MRHVGGHERSRAGDGQLNTQANRYVLQLGGDLAQWSSNAQDRWHLWTYDMMSFQKIYSPTQLANAMKLVRQQNGWTQSELAKKIGIFARMIPAALDNVKTSLPTDFPENVVTAVESNVLRLHGRLSREYGSK